MFLLSPAPRPGRVIVLMSLCVCRCMSVCSPPPKKKINKITHISYLVIKSKVTHNFKVTHNSQVIIKSKVTHNSKVTNHSKVTQNSKVTQMICILELTNNVFCNKTTEYYGANWLGWLCKEGSYCHSRWWWLTGSL